MPQRGCPVFFRLIAEAIPNDNSMMRTAGVHAASGRWLPFEVLATTWSIGAPFVYLCVAVWVFTRQQRHLSALGEHIAAVPVIRRAAALFK